MRKIPPCKNTTIALASSLLDYVENETSFGVVLSVASIKSKSQYLSDNSTTVELSERYLELPTGYWYR